MTRIIDNKDLTLESVLQESLPFTKQFDACVGYFNLRGWSRISSQLANLRSNNATTYGSPVRLIVGMAVDGEEQIRQEFDPIAQERANRAPDFEGSLRLATSQVRKFANQLVWGTPTDADLLSIRNLLSDLKKGVLKIKFAAREPLHAKLYLCHLNDGLASFRATVGSSNFTSSGLHKNGELNLEESDTQKATELLDWFNNRWDDVFTIDITDQLIDVLENSWAHEPQPSPRLVHLKMAYELSRDARSGSTLSIPANLADQIMPWQEQAIRVASQIVRNRGIVVVGDVVGLGKTLVGTGIAASAADNVLIICPKNLETMWQDHIDEYGLAGRVVPISMVQKVLPELRKFQLVLIDESHNIRNKTTQAWKALKKYIQANDCNLVLLTATMYNARVEDISSQLELKLELEEDLGIRPESHLETLSPAGYSAIVNKLGGHLSSLRAFNESPQADDWKRLLSQFLVRRTRPYLTENFAKIDEVTGEEYFEYRNGTRFSFPKRVTVPLEYPGGKDDPCDKLVSVANFEAIAKLKYARYQLGNYFRADFVPINKSEEELKIDLNRATASSGFIKTTVLKRLTSSPKAFFITVEKMLLRAHLLRWAAENGKPLPIGTLQDKAYELAGEHDSDDGSLDDLQIGAEVNEDGSWARNLTVEHWNLKASQAYEALVANTPKDLIWARPEIFRLPALINDLTTDNAALQRIIDENGSWNPANDSKLKALADLVKSLKPKEKLLVFSEYADSIKYVAKHLIPDCPGIEIGVVTGGTDSPTTFARRFAPEANAKAGGLPEGQTEIQVLLATDVLSEGQNLQDSAIIVNWDLPWTIIKIIQRAGRVDRIGQKAKEIKLYSFKPHNDLEAVLMLVDRLKNRLVQNGEILGGGETIFANPLDDNIGGLFDGSASLYAHEGEVDFSSQALSIWDKATDDERLKAKSLGDGVFTSKLSTDYQGDVLVYAVAEKADLRLIDLISLRRADGSTNAVTQLDALRYTATETLEPACALLPNHLSAMSEIMNVSILPQALKREIRHRDRTYRFLEDALEKFAGDDETTQQIDSALDVLNEFPVQPHLVAEIEEAIRKSKKNQNWVPALGAIFELNRNDDLVDSTNKELKNLKVVCSFGWNGPQ